MSPGFWVSVGWRLLLLVPGLERRLYPDHRLANDIHIEPGGDDKSPTLALVEMWGAPHLRLRLRLGNRSPYPAPLLDRLVLRTDGGATLALYDYALPQPGAADKVVSLETVLTDKQAAWFAAAGSVTVAGGAVVVCAHRAVRRPVEFRLDVRDVRSNRSSGGNPPNVPADRA